MARIRTHPGEVLREEFMTPLGLSANAVALALRVPATRIGDILHGERAATADTAMRLARYFGTTPEFWLSLQAAYDLSRAPRRTGRRDRARRAAARRDRGVIPRCRCAHVAGRGAEVLATEVVTNLGPLLGGVTPAALIDAWRTLLAPHAAQLQRAARMTAPSEDFEVGVAAALAAYVLLATLETWHDSGDRRRQVQHYMLRATTQMTNLRRARRLVTESGQSADRITTADHTPGRPTAGARCGPRRATGRGSANFT
ncbi:MAG TPA: HigA family addiction module antitoxin [Stellaceae bacterium]|nr:HigA family addiction module antitoxin [Stellaceae bacterium]